MKKNPATSRSLSRASRRAVLKNYKKKNVPPFANARRKGGVFWQILWGRCVASLGVFILSGAVVLIIIISKLY